MPQNKAQTPSEGARFGVTASERFHRYLHQEEELEPWAPRIRELAAHTEEVHVLTNNCY